MEEERKGEEGRKGGREEGSLEALFAGEGEGSGTIPPCE